MTKLNDICEVITCGVAKRPNYQNQGIPFLSSKNVKKDSFILDQYNYISNEDYKKLTKHNKPERGDILYTRVGSFGEAAVIDFDFDFAIFVSLTLIKPRKDIVFSRYLMYYLNSPKIVNLAKNSTSGIGVQNLNVKVVREFPIELPPLETQKKIAEILDNAAALRDKTQQLLEEYDALAQSIFLDMFGDPVSNPKGWEKVDFKKLFEQGKISIKPEDIEEGTKYVGLEHIKKNTGEIIDVVELNENEIKSNKYWFNHEYILYGKLRPYLNKVAAPNFEGVCSTDIIPFKPKKDKSNKFFLNHLLKGKWFVNYAVENTSGANLPRISPKFINLFKSINPPIELQNEFAEKIALIEKQKELTKQELKESEDLFNALLQKAFKGELV